MHPLDTMHKLNGEYPEDPAAPISEPYDTLGGIMAFESGELEEEAMVELFQHLVDTGMAWTLQGSYGRAAKQLIEDGLVHRVPPWHETREARNFAEAKKEPLRKGSCAP